MSCIDQLVQYKILIQLHEGPGTEGLITIANGSDWIALSPKLCITRTADKRPLQSTYRVLGAGVRVSQQQPQSQKKSPFFPDGSVVLGTSVLSPLPRSGSVDFEDALPSGRT